MTPSRRHTSASADPASPALGGLSERALREMVPAAIFERGSAYRRRGAVLDVAWRGEALHAAVQGSEDEPYRVAVRLRGDRVEAACDCPYGESREGWCKHVVAVLLTALHDADVIPRRPTIPELVAPLDRATLVRLLEAMVEEAPDVYELAADVLGRLASRSRA
jgi:uncharacterized Zn finger protein